MTTKRRTAKKAAAPEEVAPESVEAPQEEPQTEQEQPAPQGPLGEFPLPEGHYFHPPVVSPYAHSTDADGAILRLQQLLGAPLTGIYDDETVSVVRAWKEARGYRKSPLVDRETWERLDRGE